MIWLAIAVFGIVAWWLWPMVDGDDVTDGDNWFDGWIGDDGGN